MTKRTRLGFVGMGLAMLPLCVGMDCQGTGTPSILPTWKLSATMQGEGTVEIITETGSMPFVSDVIAAGTMVTLVATPADGWIFVRWEGSVTGSNPQLALTLDADHSVSAVFVAVAGLRTVSIEGAAGRMTLAIRGDQVRGNRRGGDFGADLEGTLIGNQLSLTSSAPGFGNAVLTATVGEDGSLIGTINGSGYANTPLSGDPVALTGFEHDAAGQRTTVVDGTNGILTVSVLGTSMRGTWRMFGSFGADVDGTVTGNQIAFTTTTPGFSAATVSATIQADQSWVGTINGSGFTNAPFSAQPSFFP